MIDRYTSDYGATVFDDGDLLAYSSNFRNAETFTERLNQLEYVRLAAKAHVNDSSATNLLALVNALEDCEPKTTEQLLQERLDAADQIEVYFREWTTTKNPVIPDSLEAASLAALHSYSKSKATHERALERFSQSDD